MPALPRGPHGTRQAQPGPQLQKGVSVQPGGEILLCPCLEDHHLVQQGPLLRIAQVVAGPRRCIQVQGQLAPALDRARERPEIAGDMGGR